MSAKVSRRQILVGTGSLFASRRIFTCDWRGSHDFIEVELEPDEIAEMFVNDGYTRDWLLSSRYYGEVENLRRLTDMDELKEYAPNSEDFLREARDEFESAEFSQLQIHVRVCQFDGRTFVLPHVELDAVRHPIRHVNADLFSVVIGAQYAWDVLEERAEDRDSYGGEL